MQPDQYAQNTRSGVWHIDGGIWEHLTDQWYTRCGQWHGDIPKRTKRLGSYHWRLAPAPDDDGRRCRRCFPQTRTPAPDLPEAGCTEPA